MKRYAMMDTAWGKTGFGLFLFAMLLLARDTLITSCLFGFNRSQFLMLGLIAAYGLVFLIRNRKQWKQLLLDPRMLAVFGSALVLLIPMVFKRDWQMMYFSVLLCLLFGIFLTFFTDLRQVSRYYLVILCALGLYSLIASYGLKYLVISGKLAAPVFYNSSDWEFYNFGLGFAVTSPYWRRNFGIFREPGVYQFFLLLGLYLNNYKACWKREAAVWTINGILTAVMVSTFAVGGFIETGLLYFFLYFDKKYYRSRSGRWLGIAAVLVGAAVVSFVVIQSSKPGAEGTLFFEFQDLVTRLTTDSESLKDRLDAIFVNIRHLLRHPLLGAEIAPVLHGTANNTSSTLILYAILGVVGGSVNVAAWMALAWERKRSLFGNGLLLLILFMSFNTQNLIADVFFWLFPMMALVERVIPKWTERKA